MKKSELMQLLTSGNLAKLPLRQFLKDNKGCEVLNSHKKGFSVPIRDWWRKEHKVVLEESIKECHKNPSFPEFVVSWKNIHRSHKLY